MSRTFKCGRLPKRPDARRDRLARVFRAESLPTPPAAVDWSGGRADWGVMLNDRLGDCAIAAPGHIVMAATLAVTGTAVVVPDAAVEAAYSAVGGYDPSRDDGRGNNPTDAGCNQEDVLAYWRDTGIGGHRIYGWAPLDPHDPDQLKAALWLFGNVYWGVELPRGAANEGVTEWSAPCFGDIGGHAVSGVGPVTVVTWGGLLTMTLGFQHARAQEAYAALLPEWFDAATGKSPAGYTLAESGRFLIALGGAHGTLPAGPAPPDAPPPLPVPPAQAPDPLDFGDLL